MVGAYQAEAATRGVTIKDSATKDSATDLHPWPIFRSIVFRL